VRLHEMPDKMVTQVFGPDGIRSVSEQMMRLKAAFPAKEEKTEPISHEIHGRVLHVYRPMTFTRSQLRAILRKMDKAMKKM